MNLTVTIDESAWGFALGKSNAEAKAAHDAAEAGKPEADRAEFVPVLLADYVQARLTYISDSYSQQQVAEHLALLARESPASIARMAKVAQSPTEVKDALAAEVDALPGI